VKVAIWPRQIVECRIFQERGKKHKSQCLSSGKKSSLEKAGIIYLVLRIRAAGAGIEFPHGA